MLWKETFSYVFFGKIPEGLESNELTKTYLRVLRKRFKSFHRVLLVGGLSLLGLAALGLVIGFVIAGTFALPAIAAAVIAGVALAGVGTLAALFFELVEMQQVIKNIRDLQQRSTQKITAEGSNFSSSLSLGVGGALVLSLFLLLTVAFLPVLPTVIAGLGIAIGGSLLFLAAISLIAFGYRKFKSTNNEENKEEGSSDNQAKKLQPHTENHAKDHSQKISSLSTMDSIKETIKFVFLGKVPEDLKNDDFTQRLSKESDSHKINTALGVAALMAGAVLGALLLAGTIVAPPIFIGLAIGILFSGFYALFGQMGAIFAINNLIEDQRESNAKLSQNKITSGEQLNNSNIKLDTKTLISDANSWSAEILGLTAGFLAFEGACLILLAVDLLFFASLSIAILPAILGGIGIAAGTYLVVSSVANFIAGIYRKSNPEPISASPEINNHPAQESNPGSHQPQPEVNTNTTTYNNKADSSSQNQQDQTPNQSDKVDEKTAETRIVKPAD